MANLTLVCAMSAPSFNLVGGHEASYSVSPDGNTIVSVRNAKPVNFRQVYVGAAWSLVRTHPQAGVALGKQQKRFQIRHQPNSLKP